MTIFSPTIILIASQLGENIGAAARVMKNFGFSDLRIVNPRDGWPNPAAQSMAAGGLDVVQNAKLYGSTREAIADLHYVYATTARPRDMEKPAISAHDFTTHLKSLFHRDETLQEMVPSLEPASSRRSGARNEGQHNVGILFGPERSGLANDDVALADTIVYVPVNPEYPSLNLAQTVALVAYECSKLMIEHYSQGHHPEHQAQTKRPEQMPANKSELGGFFDQLESELDTRNFWKVAEKKPQMWINLRNIFTRAQLSRQEVQTLRGLVRSLTQR